jgi:N-succinyldiaminopimelate aminotransferase
VTVLPGSFVARDAHGTNPGRRRIRLALVANQDECAEAVARIVAFTHRLAAAPAPARAG